MARPDGTLRDEFLLPRGYWEAKDTGDELEVEIKQKIRMVIPSPTPFSKIPAAPSFTRTAA